MDLYQYLEQLTGYNQLQLDDFYSKLTEKKYSSLLASPFVNSRQLNYWLEEMKLLPEKEERGWRKFSFVELSWLKIISELREFGVGFDIIKKLKEDLFFTPEPNNLKEIIIQNQHLLDKLNAKSKNKDEKKILTFLKGISEIKEELDAASGIPVLLTYLQGIIYMRSPGHILINNEGEHLFIVEKIREVYMQNEDYRFFLMQSHISISLTDIVQFYITKDNFDDEIVRSFLTDEELALLEIIRNEKLKSLTISFNEKNEIKSVDLLKIKNIDVTSRLSHLFLTNGYEEIKIVTQKGKVVNCTINEKRKFK